MQLPIIHLNGTSAEDLREGYLTAATAIGDAIDAIGKIEFNARDYYCSPEPGAWEKARKEFIDRINRLADVRLELTQIAMHCQQALDDKEARRKERGQA